MRKLLPTAFLMASCTLHTNAQQATLPHKTPTKAALQRATASLSSATVKEFCLNYPNFYYDLPNDYRLESYYRFKAANLNLHDDIDFAMELSNNNALREVAYKSLYDYCADIQFRYQQPIAEILYILLYNDLHMNVGPATLLVQYCEQHYHRTSTAEPAPHSFTQLLTEKTDANSNIEKSNATHLAESDTHHYEHSDKVSSLSQPESTERKVYTYVEQMPQLPGGSGNATIVATIQKATKYTPLALRNQIEGRVFVSFTVNPQGDVSDVKLVKGLGSGLDEETLRAVYQLPQFVPGRQNGQAVAVSFTVPITYTLPKGTNNAP